MHTVRPSPHVPLFAQRRLYVGLSALLLAAVAVVAAYGPKLRHLALPVWSAAPAVPGAPVVPLSDDERWTSLPLGHVRGRVGALVRMPDGALWVGGFDTGLFRIAGAQVTPVGGLEGRERMVHALVVHRGRVFAGTSAGIVELSLRGQKRSVHLRGTAVDALLPVEDELLAGTPRGLYRLSRHGVFEDVLARDPSGEPLRVSALAEQAGLLWMGTPSGAYSMPLSALKGPRDRRVARWLPLVFGTSAAQTNVVLAATADARGAMVGTDDGGLVRVPSRGEVRALRFADARANQINPGASCSLGELSAFGTQGGGVLLVGPELQPKRIATGAVSAVLCEPGGITLGTADGQLLQLVPKPATN